MRNACDSDSRCGLACDASARDAKSLAMWVERCEPLSTKAKAKENLLEFNLFRKRGLLLWLVRAQHDHYESKCERKSGGI